MTEAATDLSQRTPEQIFAHHAEALGKEDVEAILLDYADTAFIITPEGVHRGKDAIRQVFTSLIQALPQAQWDVKTTFADNILFLQWTADSRRGSVADGVDTFVFGNGLIQAQTVRFTLVPKA
jgi:hypothetical protein